MSAPADRGTVLVLEDDAGIGQLQRRNLERAGYRVRVARGTAAARAALAAERVDLLVLDYELGEAENGLEFYRALQNEGRDLPAILVTGFGDEARMLEAMRAGVRDFIPKSPNFVALVAPTVDRVMKQVRGERQLFEAEAASRAKDHFLATLSHELRTPLTPVLALVSALENDPRLPADVTEDLATIARNIELEARLIDDLLDITRIVRGKLELRLATIDIRPIIEHAVRTCCAHEAAEKKIVCCQDLAAENHTARVDAARLTQVFWNLLKNAIKFTPAGGRTFVRSRSENGALLVEIEDTGLGIAPEILPRIFAAFEQGDRAITRQFGGLGLGLAISRAILEAHGGSIAAHSLGLGKGALFSLRLPLADAAAATAEPMTGEPRDPAPEPFGGAPGAHLLLVEDHADTAAVLARLLRRAGFQVTVAGTVAQGLAAADAAARAVDPSGRLRPIGLVLSDLGLPDGHGTELMRALVEKHRLRGIALSGFGMEEDTRAALAAGFSHHLTKPLNPDLLLTTIQQMLLG